MAILKSRHLFQTIILGIQPLVFGGVITMTLLFGDECSVMCHGVCHCVLPFTINWGLLSNPQTGYEYPFESQWLYHATGIAWHAIVLSQHYLNKKITWASLVVVFFYFCLVSYKNLTPRFTGCSWVFGHSKTACRPRIALLQGYSFFAAFLLPQQA